MTRRLAGAVASCLALLAGLWLILAPFALGIQPSGVDWKDETFTDVWSGIGLGVLGLIGLIAFAAALLRYVRDQGLVAPRRTAAPAESAPPPVARAGEGPTGQPPAGELDRLLAPLITALTDDLNRDRERAAVNGEVHGVPGGVRDETAPEPTRQRPADPSRDLPGATR